MDSDSPVLKEQIKEKLSGITEPISVGYVNVPNGILS
jgi:hypothetical protein